MKREREREREIRVAVERFGAQDDTHVQNLEMA